ncbi:TPA: cytochrome c oxidase subunit 1 [Trebouxia sp. C0005]
MHLSCARQRVGAGYPTCSTLLWHPCCAASQLVSCTRARIGRSLLTTPTRRSGSVSRQHKGILAIAQSHLDASTSDSVQGRVLTVHYHRRGDVKDWRLNTWGEVENPTKEYDGLQPDRFTDSEAQFRLKLIPDHQKNGYSHWIGLQLRKGDQLDAGGEIVEISTDTHEVWLVQGMKEVFMEKVDINSMLTGDLTKSYAHWTDQHTVLWRIDEALLGQDEPVFKLHYSRQGNLELTGEGVTHADGSYQLQATTQHKPGGRFPHLAGCRMLVVPALPYDEVGHFKNFLALSCAALAAQLQHQSQTGNLYFNYYIIMEYWILPRDLPAAAKTGTNPSNMSAPQALFRAEAVAGTQPAQAQSAPGILTLPEQLAAIHLYGQTDRLLTAVLILQCQLAVTMETSGRHPLAATGVQTPGILDDLFFYDGLLGAHLGPQGVAISLWAPTAQQVDLLVFDGPNDDQAFYEEHMTLHKGVWSHRGPTSWRGKYYQYRITVFCPDSQQVETLTTTDPYSLSLAADGTHTQIVSMDDDMTMPEGWALHTPLPAAPWTDISIYELHIRDFSMSDKTVPEELRGKYQAFSLQDSAGVAHLRTLRSAGLTHVHLLPSYDYGSVPERAQDQATIKEDLSKHAIDSEEQQAAVLAIADKDGFNWGYDPVHYMAPEGSYASNPDGSARVVEFRQMVQSLHGLGLKVVLDVVYNHTFAAGQHTRYSVLDKVVPGYYYRRMENGDICMSTCCNNTASEHAMCERLVIDDIVHWAKDYMVDGFRFDIMGHLMLSTMKKIQAALAALTLEADGVDGKGLYIYGEAWDFGEVSSNQRGVNASQVNLGGTGLGSFNDRFRDAVVGGSPFASPLFQGWVTGLGTASNQFMQEGMSEEARRDLLMEYTDELRLSMAANLQDYHMQSFQGEVKAGREYLYSSQPSAYAKQPWETVNYADCHDGQTLFDQVISHKPETIFLKEYDL